MFELVKMDNSYHTSNDIFKNDIFNIQQHLAIKGYSFNFYKGEGSRWQKGEFA